MQTQKIYSLGLAAVLMTAAGCFKNRDEQGAGGQSGTGTETSTTGPAATTTAEDTNNYGLTANNAGNSTANTAGTGATPSGDNYSCPPGFEKRSMTDGAASSPRANSGGGSTAGDTTAGNNTTTSGTTAGTSGTSTPTTSGQADAPVIANTDPRMANCIAVNQGGSNSNTSQGH